MTEEEILRRYSNPGLRKHELTRSEHKWKLSEIRYPHCWCPRRLSEEEIENILNQVHGEKIE